MHAICTPEIRVVWLVPENDRPRWVRPINVMTGRRTGKPKWDGDYGRLLAYAELHPKSANCGAPRVLFRRVWHLRDHDRPEDIHRWPPCEAVMSESVAPNMEGEAAKKC